MDWQNLIDSGRRSEEVEERGAKRIPFQTGAVKFFDRPA